MHYCVIYFQMRCILFLKICMHWNLAFWGKEETAFASAQPYSYRASNQTKHTESGSQGNTGILSIMVGKCAFDVNNVEYWFSSYRAFIPTN